MNHHEQCAMFTVSTVFFKSSFEKKEISHEKIDGMKSDIKRITKIRSPTRMKKTNTKKITYWHISQWWSMAVKKEDLIHADQISNWSYMVNACTEMRMQTKKNRRRLNLQCCKIKKVCCLKSSAVFYSLHLILI